MKALPAHCQREEEVGTSGFFRIIFFSHWSMVSAGKYYPEKSKVTITLVLATPVGGLRKAKHSARFFISI
jgi:hypothetical protein